MSFQSLEYLLFLPIVFLLYWIICQKSKILQNGLLVLASMIFYGWWDWRFLGLLLCTAFSTFLFGWWMGQTTIPYKRKILLVTTIVLNVGILFYFKYYNFFVQTFIDTLLLFGRCTNIHTLEILLPVGISFYTFTALSYSIDVYQRKIEPSRDILAYFAYVMFFPCILSGPISRAQKQLPQYSTRRRFDYDNTICACKLILWGGGTKLCLADRLGIYVDTVYANIAQHNGITLLFTSILYSIQIYADFAGYSLMAIGSGKLFGIDLQTNFTRPYFATTVTDFWHRWHISLTTWFRDYIYFPLGGNRCSKRRWVINTMVVFIISGLWHGAAYTFLIWGALHGTCMVIERLIYGGRIKYISHKLTVSNVFRLIVTFSIVNFAWIFFRADSLNDAMMILKKMFTEKGALFSDPDTLFFAFIFMVLVFVTDYVDEYHPGKLRLINNKYAIIRWSTCLILATMVLLFGVLDGGSFIYFQF